MRPGEIWLMTVLPTAPPSVSNCTTAASSVSTARFSPPPLPRANAAVCSACRRSGHRGERAGAEAGDPLARDELGEVAPVRADVGEGARGAAERRVDAPVVVLGVGQPVLQVGAVHEPDRAGGAGADAVARLADRGVVAVDERHRGGGAGGGGRVDEPRRAGEVGRERLLADHVLAGGQGGLGERQVEVVRGADVHHVDVGRGDELLGGREGALGAERAGRLLGAGRATRRRRRRCAPRPAGRSGRGRRR